MKLFTDKELHGLPPRGRFNALEVVEEYIENFAHFLVVWEGRADGPENARSVIAELDSDLRKIIDHLEGEDAHFRLQVLNAMRDQMRELV